MPSNTTLLRYLALSFFGVCALSIPVSAPADILPANLMKSTVNPVVTGAPVLKHQPYYAGHPTGRACDADIPPSVATLTATEGEICLVSTVYEYRHLKSLRPEPNGAGFVFQTRSGRTAGFVPKESYRLFTACLGDGDAEYRVWERNWEGCVANSGVLTPDSGWLTIKPERPIPFFKQLVGVTGPDPEIWYFLKRSRYPASDG